jgi:hypothetical protein
MLNEIFAKLPSEIAFKVLTYEYHPIVDMITKYFLKIKFNKVVRQLSKYRYRLIDDITEGYEENPDGYEYHPDDYDQSMDFVEAAFEYIQNGW